MYSSKIMLFLLLVLATTISACSTAPKQAAAPNEPETIVFVCQHGNVKSLMAASYFNQMAKSQNLPYYAVSRSIEQESKAVPQPISSKLSGEGIDVSSFQSKSISSSDIITAKRVVTIGVALPENFQSDNVTIEKWDSIPSVSADFSASSNAMKQNLESLIYQLRPKTGQ